MAGSIALRDDAFVVEMDGSEARLEFDLEDGRMLLLHTEVPPAFQGQGMGGRLVSAAVGKARADRLVIVPWCPYARKWLKDHADATEGVEVDFKTPPPGA